jgi:hypothetical protein
MLGAWKNTGCAGQAALMWSTKPGTCQSLIVPWPIRLLSFGPLHSRCFGAGLLPCIALLAGIIRDVRPAGVALDQVMKYVALAV